jgi:hypothetical protein
MVLLMKLGNPMLNLSSPPTLGETYIDCEGRHLVVFSIVQDKISILYDELEGNPVKHIDYEEWQALSPRHCGA